MAGLAALLSFGSDRTTAQTLQALSDALAPRGAGEVMAESGVARLLMRSALPMIHEADHAAVIIDGIAEVSSLVDRYQKMGPLGLLHGDQPYALVLADDEGLVLCRNLDGPPLYYARGRGAVMVASEPGALINAGIPAAPDEATVTRFLATGACDEVPATFFQGIRRVLPGQVVEVSAHMDSGGRSEGWAIRAHPPLSNRAVSPRLALRGCFSDGDRHVLGATTGAPGGEAVSRIGVVLTGAGQQDIAIPTAALLGAAISSSGTHRAVPVYSVTFPGLSAGSYAPSVLGRLTDGSVRHRAIPMYADEIDVDSYVADLGEPAPGLWGYLLWAISRATAGEIDSLLCASGWNTSGGHLSRITDRISSRYGVVLKFPYRAVDRSDTAVRQELQVLAERSLPPACVRAAAQHGQAFEAPMSEVLQRLRTEIAGALLYPRDTRPDHDALESLSNLEQSSVERLWRRYVLERWLATVVAPKQVTVPSARPEVQAKPSDVSAAGRAWQRRLLQTESFSHGDKLSDKLAWYIAEYADSAEKQVRQGFRQPWYVIVSAKPIAVVQGRARAIWDIKPGRLAKLLVRLGGQRVRHTDPWSMQEAINEGGLVRVAIGSLAAAAGRNTWYQRISGPKIRSVSPPRENACPPAHLAVIRPPEQAGAVASELLRALRRALPDEVFAALEGCAIVSADSAGIRKLGWAGAKPPPAGLIRRLCDGNPFGQSAERTPILLALSAPAARPQSGSKKSSKRQSAKRR